MEQAPIPGGTASPAPEKASQNKGGLRFWKLLWQFFLLGLGAYLIFVLFSDKRFFGLFPSSILANEWVVLGFLLLLLCLLAPHVIRIKLILYRIFLQTFLSQTSAVYTFFSHGILVKLVGLIVSIGLVIQVFIFFSLVTVHLEQYIGLCIGFGVFWLFRARYTLNKGLHFLREDLNSILRAYLIPFLLATLTGICIAGWEIWHIDEIRQVHTLADALEIALASIDPHKDFFWRPIRIMARHIYAWELLMQQFVTVPVFGKVFYFVYLIISQGSITFFAIFLMGMPFKLEPRNDKG